MGVGSGPRFGVEEEFLVVGAESRAVVSEAAAVLDAAAPRLGSRVGGEITKHQLETRTEPCDTVEELHKQLAEARGVVADVASSLGLRIIASGTPPHGDYVPPPITEGPRQDRGNETFRGLHDELSVCALHVHVEIPERDRAVLVSNHLRPYLPLLISLAGNSPYWAGRDTGYTSWRTMIWHRWPVAGPPPYFTSAEYYDRTIAMLHETGAVVDMGTVFWDIRPSAHVPTLEIRAADVPTTVEESALLAALIRALAVTKLRLVDAGDPGPVVPSELLRLAYWRAARDGLGGSAVDVAAGGRLVPAVELAEGLLEAVRPVLVEYGDFELVSGWLRELITGGDGATRQRRAHARRGQLADVVDELAAGTVPADLRR